MARHRRQLGPTLQVALVCLAAAVAPSFAENREAAVIVRVSADDLNTALARSLVDAGGPVFSGHREEATRGFADVDYRARFAPPRVSFDETGQVRVRLTVEEADVQIGRFEKKVLGRRMRCEDAGLEIRAEHPLEVDLAFRLGLDDGALALVATEVSLGDTRRSVRLIRPRKCRNKILPTRLMWWLGKPRLQRKLARLDDKLMERATERASRIDENGDLLRAHWRMAEGVAGAPHDALYLLPAELRTTGDALVVSWVHSATPERPATFAALPAWVEDEGGGSFVALSEPFLNELLGARFAGIEMRRKKPSGNFRRLLKSRRVLALIPGLREVEDRDQVSFSAQIVGAPRIGFDSLPDRDEALIRVELSDLLLHVHAGGDDRLGTLRIERGVIAVTPYWSPAGGISFGLIENRWELTSDGMRFNEELLATMLQELVFGEVFETRYNPLWFGGIDGGAGFAPRAFRQRGSHLVVGIDPPPATDPAQRAGAATAGAVSTVSQANK